MGCCRLAICRLTISGRAVFLILVAASGKIRYVRALVVKGLSRLPVTEEIAGSNPVERAKENTYPWGRYFLWHVFGRTVRIADARSAAR